MHKGKGQRHIKGQRHENVEMLKPFILGIF